MTPVRLSQAFRAVAVAAPLLAQAVIGALFIGGGGYLAWTALQHEPHDKAVLYIGSGGALLGALIFPSIFPVFQRVYVLIFPNGLPLLGGKRSSDPPAPPAP